MRFVLSALFCFFAALAVAETPHLLRSPAMSQTQIAFVYGDDVWTVARAGGDATRLTSTGNVDGGVFFSPDGRMIAFSARVGGSEDAFVIPAAGGAAKRLTYHPAGQGVLGWTPDGRSVMVAGDETSFNDFAKMFLVRADGSGLPEEVKLPSVDEASYSGDGSRIAYTPFNQWQRASWKRYRGGQTEPVWLVDVKTLDLVKVPRENSNDTNPQWVGDTVYFLSDRSGPVTLFEYDVRTKAVKQLVENRGLDLKSMTAGPGGLVYEQFGSLHVFDTAAGTEHVVEVRLGGDLPKLEPGIRQVRPDEVQNVAISPTGVRAAFEAHGEVFTVPAEKGDVRNLTNTSGAAEREPAWSPDGKRLAYFSDASGEYQLYLREQDGIAAPKVIDLGPNPTYYFSPRWSPDSKRVLFGDKRLNLWYVDVDGVGKPVKVDTDNYEGFSQPALAASFSPDGKWILYLKVLHNIQHAAFLYSMETHQTQQITDGMSDVENPRFDPNGKYVYFTASTDAGPTLDGFNLSSLNRTTSSSVYVAVLSKDQTSPIPPESDDEKDKAAAAKKRGRRQEGDG